MTFKGGKVDLKPRATKGIHHMNHMATCMVTMTTLKQEDTKGKLYMEALNVGGMTMKKILTQNKCTG